MCQQLKNKTETFFEERMADMHNLVHERLFHFTQNLESPQFYAKYMENIKKGQHI